ncbi:tripartite tricarboxylate transporter family receptor [Xylophilus ampelinus]|uniref:Tripartite tricarboxylate transporter family receptor n=1 Tax=Xylophilus ampelinus TaxID=54067 RepID=A0A318SID5_9BURK|nr:tripartite tricarboxylate transporter family receptor [Xylophilus ampelinus]
MTTAQRSPVLPDAPPVADTLKGFAIATWWGLVAPARTPHEVIARLNQAFVAALQAPETKTRFARLLADPVSGSPQEFAQFMQRELAKYQQVVKTTGAKID